MRSPFFYSRIRGSINRFMRYNEEEMERIEPKLFGFANKIDDAIRDRAHTEDPAELELYKVRWVWYHTILSILIAGTNVLLVLILISIWIK
jgi:hypothetical protein